MNITKRKTYMDAYNKRYYKSNLKKRKQYDKVYYQANKAARNKQRLHYQITRRTIDPNFKLRCYLRTRLYTALKEQSQTKGEKTFDLLGCTIETLKIHLESQFQDDMSWNNYGSWHVDHKRPCAAFNLKNPDERRQCFHYTNLQPLWAKDNLVKNDQRY